MKNWPLRALLVGLSTIAATNTWAAGLQPSPIAQGDTWVYRQADERPNNPPHVTMPRFNVSYVNQQGKFVMLVGDGNMPVTANTVWRPAYSVAKDVCILDVIGGDSLWLEPTCDADLELGKQWESEETKNQQYTLWKHKVVGRETIRVQAGSFKTIKIDSVGTVETVGKEMRRHSVYWFAPEVKGMIKVVREFYDERGVRALTLTEELQSFSAAPPAEAEMKKALKHLVASQDLEKNWPLQVSKNAASGAKSVEQGALSALEENQTLTEAERAKGKRIAVELAPQMANEITEYFRRLNVSDLVFEMVETIYPKYYSLPDIQKLAEFYDSSAFKKLIAITLAVDAEHRRTGENEESIRARYGAQFTQQDQQALMAFQQSAVWQKQQKVRQQLQADCIKFVNDRTDQGVNAIAQKYAAIVAKKLKTEVR